MVTAFARLSQAEIHRPNAEREILFSLGQIPLDHAVRQARTVWKVATKEFVTAAGADLEKQAWRASGA